MTEKQFDEIVEFRLKAIKETLIEKGKEYRRNNDPLHNFNIGAKITGTTREKVLWGFALKHHISVMDMIDDLDKDILPNPFSVEEKIGDLINYLILLEASIKDRFLDTNIFKTKHK